MTHLTGALINGLGILAGTLIGLIWGRRIHHQFRDQATKILGLVVSLIGLKMAWDMSDPVNILLSLLLGAWTGHALGLQDRLDHMGQRIERWAGQQGAVQGFLTATLIFNVGAMAIIGSIQAGLSNHPTVLQTKALLDGTTALLLSSVMGWGVALSAPVTILYEGLLSLGAHSLALILKGAVLNDLTVVGGIMVAAIGVNFLADKPIIRLADLLPALIWTMAFAGLKHLGLSFV